MESTETVAAESSPAVEAEPIANPPVMEVNLGPLVNLTSDERREFRRTGILPAPPKSKEAAASSSETKPLQAKVESSGESDPPKQQENAGHKSKPTAEERIQQLEATIEKIRKGAGLKETQQRAESSPAKPQTAEQQPNSQEPTPEDTNADGTPKYKDYEAYTKALARWEVRQELAEQRRQEEHNAQMRELNAKVDEAKTRYGENAATVIDETAGTIIGDESIPTAVTQMLRESDVLTDFLFTIGSKPEDLASFLKMAKNEPGKALRYIALTETLIHEELEGKAASAKSTEPPAKPETRAPRPPSEAGGRAAAPPDGLRAALEANDYRAASAEFKRQALAKLKG
jgi:hypothetical protein